MVQLHDEIMLRLKKHAGLTPPCEPPEHFLADLIWKAEHSSVDFEVRDVVRDIIHDLNSVNAIVNPSPDAIVRLSGIPGDLAYTISQIQLSCYDAVFRFRNTTDLQQLADDLSIAVWKITCAWDAILSGDIADVEELVRSEGAARGIPE